MKKKNKSGYFARISGLRVACLFAGLAPAVSQTAPWTLEVDAEAGVIHTDNLLLAADGLDESETVYTISPEFYLHTDGERTQAHIRYRPEAYFYSDVSDENTVYHIVDANLTTALIRDRLFLFLNGVNYQTSVTPAGSLPTTNIPVTGNRVDSRVLEARPYWRQRFGSVDLLLEAGYRDLDYDDDQVQSANERFATFDLNNFAKQAGLAWGLQYNFRRMEYEDSVPFEFQRAALNLGFWATRSLRLFAVGGAETSFDDPLDPNLDADFWEVGFQYAPNQRLNLEAAAGERSFGTSFRANLSYELRRGTLSLIYDETPSSRADTFLDVRPLVDRDILDDILNRPGDADRFVRKRGEFRAAVDLSKSNLTLRVFAENRDDRTTELGAALPEEKLSGAAARWDWRFGARTSLDIGADIARRDDGSRDDDLTRYTLGLDYNLTARTSVRIEGARAEQKGNNSSEFDYTENQARLLIRMEIR